MKSNETETAPPAEAVIHDRGRGPEIKGTRITVYSIVDYLLDGWHPDRIAAFLRVSSQQVRAAMAYLLDHRLEVMTEYVKILERSARGNPPELQAKLDANHEKFLALVKQVEEARARGEADIPGLIRQLREGQRQGNEDARNHGGQ